MKKANQTPGLSFQSAVLPWLAVIAWAVLIFYLSAQPSLTLNLGAWEMVPRKMAHMGEFAVLCLLLWNAVRQHGVAFARALMIAGAGAFLYAASDEFHQYFIAGRYGTPRDVAIDFIGILTMSLIIIRVRPKKTTRTGALRH
ncbi:MAG: VanZ family protein [Thermoleophilia bacterium]